MASTTVELEEFIHCLICDAENDGQAVVCSTCFAPLMLAEQADQQGQDPCITTVLGDSNVGKTVYLGFLLDMLAKRAGDFEAIPKGAYSINLQQSVIHHLAARTFPPKTPADIDQWHWAYYQVCDHRNKDRWIDLVMPDMAGEALAAEVDAPNTYQVIGKLLRKSAGTLLLVDAGIAALGSPGPDFFALKLLTYLDQLYAVKRRRKVSSPVAVVLCKGDYCPQCFDDPRAFAKTNLSRTWNFCESRFAKVEFFAASVVGSLGFINDDDDNVISVPLHTAPRGILEPFEWIVKHL